MKLSVLVAPLALIAATPAVAAEADITAVGRSWHGLQIAGPDALGRYTLRVDITDLDPTSPAGWATMTHRVAMGTSLLCDAATPQAYAGFYDRQSRECRDESDASAFAQMTRARDLARGGEPVAWLDLKR
jgi:UrcA family protein